MRYFIDKDGKYLGGSDGAPLSEYEVPSAPPHATQKWNGITYDECTLTYLEQRVYPSIGDQLDMQYWDSVNGTTIWADTIAAIKAEFPKGEI